jgi:hypothetical protein
MVTDNREIVLIWDPERDQSKISPPCTDSWKRERSIHDNVADPKVLIKKKTLKLMKSTTEMMTKAMMTKAIQHTVLHFLAMPTDGE